MQYFHELRASDNNDVCNGLSYIFSESTDSIRYDRTDVKLLVLYTENGLADKNYRLCFNTPDGSKYLYVGNKITIYKGSYMNDIKLQEYTRHFNYKYSCEKWYAQLQITNYIV